MSDEPDPLPAARAGDRDAWRVLHERYAPAVHAVLLCRVDRVEAQDLVQATFLAALERLDQLRDDEAFGPWLMAIARNLATSHHRRRRRFVSLPEVLVFHRPPELEARRALEAIRALPEAYAELMMMRLVEGMTGPEIAERTGRPPGSVRVSLHRGMALLRERLGGGA